MKMTNTTTMTNKVKPSELFGAIKSGLNHIEKHSLKRYMAVANKLLAKAEVTNQVTLQKRLEFRIDTLAKELTLATNHGINTYVDRDAIFEYIEQTEAREVKLSSIRDYLREVPDEAIDIISKTREIFDDFFILFTDYTGETAKQADKLVKEKDPILFGIFYDLEQDEIMERMYFLHDWEDEYCDLTLDKLIEEYKEISDEEIVKTTSTNISKETKELKVLAKSHKEG